MELKRRVRPQARESRYSGFGVNPLMMTMMMLTMRLRMTMMLRMRKPKHGEVTEVDKALEKEDDVDGEDENEEDEEGLVVAEVPHVEVLGQLLLQLFSPTFCPKMASRELGSFPNTPKMSPLDSATLN